MRYKITVTKAADNDFEENFLWYAKTSPALAIKFRDNVKKAIDFIVDKPFACPTILEDARQIIVTKFPYRKIFIVEKDEIIVISILHQKRSLKIWKKNIINH